MSLAKSDQGWISGQPGDGIVTVGDPRLKAPTLALDNAAGAADLLDEMVDRLRRLNGAGLAAPQIGASVKAVVIEVRKTDVFPDRPVSPLIQMLNPVIVASSEPEVVDWEGCFSVPGIMGKVPRFDSVTVEYLARSGERVVESYSGYVARVVQHELDHLDATEFLDRMTSMDTISTVENFIKSRTTQA
jgi:peptide deformylase